MLSGSLLAGGVLLGLVLSGCAPTPPGPHPSSTVPDVVSPGPTTAAVPTVKPMLSASENLAYFDSVSAGALAANPSADGRAFIDALAAAGFDKTQMEVTFDTTAANLAADSIQFAVRFNGECLIGQHGPASDGFHSMVAPLLGTGRCLVGATRQIDW
ncbi:DUF6993 domain-containing protein [Glaciibacter sp. 2TAF33]|uniref:DUF6993 domain-containing protein n=1 Tax=Glaciibacter sp. 2TAF33 TaxID=3233015 RepID=UPI003F8DDCF7